MKRDEIMAEFVAGYLDSYDVDCPPPGPNRSPAYRHSFNVGRAELAGDPLDRAEVLRRRAAMIEHAMEADYGY